MITGKTNGRTMDELNEIASTLEEKRRRFTHGTWLACLWPGLPLFALLLGERGMFLLAFRFIFTSVFIPWCVIGLLFAADMYRRKRKPWRIVLIANLAGLALYATMRFGDVISM
jgi:hypothetical protein